MCAFVTGVQTCGSSDLVHRVDDDHVGRMVIQEGAQLPQARQRLAGCDRRCRALTLLREGGCIAAVRLQPRSEDSRLGNAWVSTCRTRWSPNHYKKQNKRSITRNRMNEQTETDCK